MGSVIKRERVRLEAPQPNAGAGSGEASHASTAGRESRDAPGATQLELIEADGRVRAIQVTCGCGEVALIELEYEPVREPPEPPKPLGGSE